MNSKIRSYSRAQAAKATNVNAETIRYYETCGLLQPPARSAGGQRIYIEEHLQRLIFIRRSRELGFTLKEIKDLISLSDGSDRSCSQVRDLSVVHLRDIKAKIRDLKKMEKTLADMIKQCDANTTPTCPIIGALTS